MGGVLSTNYVTRSLVIKIILFTSHLKMTSKQTKWEQWNSGTVAQWQKGVPWNSGTVEHRGIVVQRNSGTVI